MEFLERGPSGDPDRQVMLFTCEPDEDAGETTVGLLAVNAEGADSTYRLTKYLEKLFSHIFYPNKKHVNSTFNRSPLPDGPLIGETVDGEDYFLLGGGDTVGLYTFH